MIFDKGRRALWAGLWMLMVGFGGATWGATFAPISDAEKALQAAPGDPSAMGVVLFEKAYCRLQDYPRDVTSRLDVEVRVKILTEEGIEALGEIEIPHSKFQRLHDFAGRTVLPDGRVVPLTKEAIFRETVSQSSRRFVTKAAFPALEVGAIIDYRYSLHWDSFFLLEPWLFANRVPTLRSEITYAVPKGLGVDPWGREVNDVKLSVTQDRSADGRLLTVSATDIPAVPDEVSSFPFVDLSTRFMVVPTVLVSGGVDQALMQSWDTTCDLLETGYKEARRKTRDARKGAKALTASVGPQERLEVLLRFVRDEIQTTSTGSVIGGEPTLDKVFKERRGSSIHKALLLQEMLSAVGLSADLVLAANRIDGRVDLEVANPWWFERALLRVSVAGRQVFLDPIDRHLVPGEISPAFEGMPALVYHPRKPEKIVLPSASSAQHRERAEVELAVVEDGGQEGSGRLLLTGHQAWLHRALSEGQDETAYWQERLDEDFAAYRVDDVAVVDAGAEGLTVSWSLASRPDADLGDEIRLQPSRPVGPVRQPFLLSEEQRRTPVQLAFGRIDEVDFTVTWPEGWEVLAMPEGHLTTNGVGRSVQQVRLDEASRELRYQRLFELKHRELGAGSQYRQVRELFASAEEGDGQSLVLVGP